MATDKHSGASGPALEARIAVLEELFVRLAQAGATECILENGFKTISDRLQGIADQMAPLRSLGPGVPTVSSEQDKRIRKLETALISPQRSVLQGAREVEKSDEPNEQPSEKPEEKKYLRSAP